MIEGRGLAWFVICTLALTGGAEARDRLDCDHPLEGAATREAIVSRFGADAVAGQVDLGWGDFEEGVILYATEQDPGLGITFLGPDISSIGTTDRRWEGPGGVHVGATLAEIEAANGRPFEISDFFEGYDGWSVDWKGGKLDNLPGGCRLSLQFTALTADIRHLPESVLGEIPLPSDHPDLRKAGLTVRYISVGWSSTIVILPAQTLAN